MREHNAFKVELAQRAIVRGLTRRHGRQVRDEPRRSAGPSTASTGRAKVTGGARYTARDRAAGPGATPRSSARRSRAGGSPRIDTAPRRSPPAASSRSSPTRTCPKVAAAPHLLPSLRRRARRRARASSRCRTTSCTTPASRSRSSSPTATSARSTRRRWSTSATSGRRRSRRSTRAATRAYEAERLFGGLMPGRNERGDVDDGARRRPTCASTSPTGSPPTTTTRSSRRPPPRSGTATGSRSTTRRWASGRPSSPSPQLLGHPARRDVRVITHFVGGGFGCKAMVWPHVTLAAMAARHVGRPVRLALTRPQMFTSHGHREEQEQRLALGATRDGRLTAIRHHKLSITSPFDDWAEPATGVSSQLYACANYEGVHRLIRGNTMTPTFTRGPGEALGVFALETRDGRARRTSSASTRSSCALRNHADVDPQRQPVVERRPGGVPAPRRRALRLGAARPGAALAARRRLADRHRHGRRRLPGRRSSCRPSAPARASTPTAAPSCRPATQEFGTGVDDRDDPGRRRRARRRRSTPCASRPATPTCPTPRRRSARRAPAWSAPRCTPPRRRCATSSSAMAVADDGLAAARRRPGGGRGARRADGAARPARTRRDLRRAAAAQPPRRRRGARAAGPRRRSTRRTGC